MPCRNLKFLYVGVFGVKILIMITVKMNYRETWNWEIIFKILFNEALLFHTAKDYF